MKTMDKLMIAGAILVGLTLGFAIGFSLVSTALAQERPVQLNRGITLRQLHVNGSRVNIAKGPIRMVEALPGCPGYPCGRQNAMLPSVNGRRHGAAIAIGGDFVRNGRPVHAYVHNGRTRNRGIRNGDVFFLRKDGPASIQRGHDWMLPEAEELFGGYPQVLTHGVVPSDRGDCKNVDGPDGGFCLRQPRQGIGLSKDGRTAIIIEVDGRQKGSRGMLLPEFGRLFHRFGAYDALNVDGGGSAVMWSRKRNRRVCEWNEPKGCLVSRPVYKAKNPPHGERRVAQSIALVP